MMVGAREEDVPIKKTAQQGHRVVQKRKATAQVVEGDINGIGVNIAADRKDQKNLAEIMFF